MKMQIKINSYAISALAYMTLASCLLIHLYLEVIKIYFRMHLFALGAQINVPL